MFHSQYESRLRSPSRGSPSKSINWNQDLPPLGVPNFEKESDLVIVDSNISNNNNNINSNHGTPIQSNNNNNNSNENIYKSKTSPIKLNSSSSNNNSNYADRFISIPILSESLDKFSGLDILNPIHFPSSTLPNTPTTISAYDKHENNLAYNLILKNEILGNNSIFEFNSSLQQFTNQNTSINSLSISNSPNHNIYTNNNNNNNDSNTTATNTNLSQSFSNGTSFSQLSLLEGADDIIDTTSSSRNILQYKSTKKKSKDFTDSPYSLSPLSDNSQKLLSSPRKPQRKISKIPFKVLDAPAILDDFYLNLIDWSSQNVVAVALERSVYLWNATTSQVSKLCDYQSTTNNASLANSDREHNNVVTSVSWIQRGSHLAIGGADGLIQIWDVTRMKKIRELQGHSARVNSLAWNNHILSSGSKDKSIVHHDVRESNHFTARLFGHRNEVCGLKWSPDGQQLASGGNDNLLAVWDIASSRPLHQFKYHNAAVKAIAWSPHQRGLLASGGGTHDKCIRFWNTGTGSALQSIDTGSQVCNLAWSKNVNELVSTHGYSQNQITIWSYPTMRQVTTLTGHTTRVLYLAVSPDGQTIITGAGDQTLRLWNIFPNSKETNLYSPSSLENLYSKKELDIR